MSFADVFRILFQGLFVVAPLLAAVLVGLLTRGRVRALGVAGFALFALDGVLGVLWVIALPQLADILSVSLRVLSEVYSAVRGLVSLAAVALLLFAVVVDRARPPGQAVRP